MILLYLIRLNPWPGPFQNRAGDGRSPVACEMKNMVAARFRMINGYKWSVCSIGLSVFMRMINHNFMSIATQISVFHSLS